MSEFYPLSRVTYQDYLQSKSFLEDVKTANNKMSAIVSKDLRQIVASNNDLHRLEIQARDVQHKREMDYLQRINQVSQEHIKDVQRAVLNGNEIAQKGFEVLNFNISNIGKSINDISAQLRWGSAQILSQIGHMNDTIDELLELSKNPTHTHAMEHFNNARIDFDKGWYPEAIQEIDYVINGVPGAYAPYLTEWRVYQLLGTIRLGFFGCDISLIDLPEAESSFLKAARYAEKDYPDEAALAYVSAGWSAYCQNRIQACIDHTNRAVVVAPQLAESYFQLSKAYMVMNNEAESLLYLEKALLIDMQYSLKAISDPAFQTHSNQIHEYLADLRERLYKDLSQQVFELVNTDNIFNIEDLQSKLKSALGERTILGYTESRDMIKKLLGDLYKHKSDRLNLHKSLSANKIRLKELNDLLTNIQKKNITVSSVPPSYDEQIDIIEKKLRVNNFTIDKECKASLTALDESVSGFIKNLKKEISNHFSEQMNEYK